MPLSNIHIRPFTGSSIGTYLPSIARLRIEIFREYPFLQERDLDEEILYLKRHVESKESIAVIIFDGSMIVGASTGLPLQFETENIHKPFLEKKLDIPSYFYFSESILLKNYRGRGIGHHFFDIREEHVKNMKNFSHICFCSIIRPENHPKKPSDYMPLTGFWSKRGYTIHPDFKCTMAWKDIGEKQKTRKEFCFWIKEITLLSSTTKTKE